MTMIETVGFLELNSIAKGVEAADAILKAAQVELTFAKPVCPGKYSICLLHTSSFINRFGPYVFPAA